MTLTGQGAIAGVMGWPIAHSRSPQLHGFWLRRYDIDGAYIPLAVRPEDVEAAFLTLPRLGFRSPAGRMANWQPIVYGGGQLMHVLGLAWSGGYGVQRKTAGAAQGLDNIPEVIGMGMMGLGGLIAIIGGVMFLLVVFLAMRPEK